VGVYPPYIDRYTVFFQNKIQKKYFYTAVDGVLLHTVARTDSNPDTMPATCINIK
jgi:hypothetical protein